MVEEIKALPTFTTIKYVTKEGENATATKNNGIVTINGDKNGVRQMPLDDFIKNELPNVKSLENSPAADTVEISAKPAEKEEAPKAQEAVNAQATEEEEKPEAGKKLDVAA